MFSMEVWASRLRHHDYCFRFWLFAALHVCNYVANVTMVVYYFCALETTFFVSSLYYVSVLLSAQVIVGLYCFRLSWTDMWIKEVSTKWIGPCGRVLVCTFLGLTQLVQLKIAYSKFMRDEQRRGEDHEEDDEDSIRASITTQVTDSSTEARRGIILENMIPWVFPAKSFEGVFEGCLFALVMMYTLMKVGWDDTYVIDLWFKSSWVWYFIIYWSGTCSFITVGISMVNLDYHLSPAVRKAVDRSFLYTAMHTMFRACESGFRITTLVMFALAFRACNNFWITHIPAFIIFSEYVFCVCLLLSFSTGGKALKGCVSMRKLLGAMLVGMLFKVTVLTEFMQEKSLKSATLCLSRYFRCVRLVDFVATLSLVLHNPCPIHVDGGPDKGVNLLELVIMKHKAIFGAYIFATCVYYVMLLCNFHRYAEQSAEAVEATLVISKPPSLEARRPSTMIAETPQTLVSSLRTITGSVRDFPGSSSSVLLDGADENSINVMRRASVEEPLHEVAISVARDSELPSELTEDLKELAGTWYYAPQTDHEQLGVLQALLSRGLHGSVGKLLAPIAEDAAEGCDGNEDFIEDRVKMSDFKVGQLLGGGTYAPVFRCTKGGEVFAMKRLTKNKYIRRENVSLPRRERDTLSCVRHPNVVALEWAFETSLFYVLVMELCDLGSLKKLIADGGKPGLPLETSVRIGGHVLQGLHHLHVHRILHRDLKPDNIGLNGPKDKVTAKLIDFGFARRTDSGRARTIVGTHGYCAPEIERVAVLRSFGPLSQGPDAYDERVDLYSFGVTLFVTMVGNPSLEDRSIWTHYEFRALLWDPGHCLWSCQHYKNHHVDSYAVFDHLEATGAYRTIDRLTATDPNERPRTAVAAATFGEGLFSKYRDSVPHEWFVHGFDSAMEP